VRDTVVGPLTLVEVAVAILLFLRILLDVRLRRSIAALNRQLQGDQPFRQPRIRLFDPEWGLFGWRGGGLPLAIVRAILLVEFVITGFLMNAFGNGPVYLACSAVFVAVLLSMLYAGITGAAERAETSA